MLEEQPRAAWRRADLEHSYPHCWRCHNPVIFRATEQWFIGLETPVKRADGTETTFRQLAIEEIDKVVWDPAWGKERITNMIATRPDWCISRQRIWGVPIAVFLCENCHKPILDPALNRKIVDLFEREGVEAWHTTPIEDLLPAERSLRAMRRHRSSARKPTFSTSGSTPAQAGSPSANPIPISNPPMRSSKTGEGTECLYLEGGDQHRGWFHSSLLTSVALRGRAPYSHVATAGWTLDEQGRAMSKSLGNGVDPVDIANRLGGEIVRLWVASIDFREDMAASENLMQRCADIYRKLRNTFRFLLGNLHGFDPVRDRVPEAELLPLDRYMLARTRDLTEKILGWYEAFEFHRVYQAVNEFAIVDLSSFYLDVLKDRMYTFAPTSHARRSAQTVLWQITEALVRLVAPILSFTADEVWEYLPAVEGREASVHLALFPKPEEDLLRRSQHRFWKSGSRSSPSAMKHCACLKRRARTSASARASRPKLKSPPPANCSRCSQRHAAGLKGDHQRLRSQRRRRLARLDGHHSRRSARLRPQMRALLELHARSLRLRHLAKRLHPLPRTR